MYPYVSQGQAQYRNNDEFQGQDMVNEEQIAGDYDAKKGSSFASAASFYPNSLYTSQTMPKPTSPKSTMAEFEAPPMPFQDEVSQDYSLTGYTGASLHPFDDRVQGILSETLKEEDIELKTDGNLYLPEVKYRKVLTRAFGSGGWALVPRGPHNLSQGILSREYALLALGKFVAQARGHAQVHQSLNAASVSESVRSNALMRCCKDLGIASELWDQNFVGQWRAKFAIKRVDPTGRTRQLWAKKEPHGK
jgi:hypothetical protein